MADVKIKQDEAREEEMPTDAGSVTLCSAFAFEMIGKIHLFHI